MGREHEGDHERGRQRAGGGQSARTQEAPVPGLGRPLPAPRFLQKAPSEGALEGWIGFRRWLLDRAQEVPDLAADLPVRRRVEEILQLRVAPASLVVHAPASP